MLGVIITSALAFIIILLTERAAKNKSLSTELSRKIPHLTVALTMATWPFFVNMKTVAALALAFSASSLAMRLFKLFPHARFVDRRSWGDVLFGLGIGFSALLNPPRWIFINAVLYLGIADLIAAMVGKTLGQHRYKVFGNTKTIEGSIAFTLSAMSITAMIVFLAPVGLGASWQIIFWLPLSAAVIEAVLPLGLDNLVLPIFVTAVMLALRTS